MALYPSPAYRTFAVQAGNVTEQWVCEGCVSGAERHGVDDDTMAFGDAMPAAFPEDVDPDTSTTTRTRCVRRSRSRSTNTTVASQSTDPATTSRAGPDHGSGAGSVHLASALPDCP